MLAQNTASLWAQLCNDYIGGGEEEHALRDLKAVGAFVEAAEKLFAKRPQRLCDAFEIAGDLHQAGGESRQAEGLFLRALHLATHEDLLESRARLLLKLSMLNEHLGETAVAAEQLEKAVSAYESTHNLSVLPTLLNNLAHLARSLGDSASAKTAYLRAAELAQSLHGDRHPELAEILSNYGVLLTDLRDLVEAENAHLRALGIRERTFGANHPDVARSLHNLAVVYQLAKRPDQADRYYRSAIEVLSKFVPPDDPELQIMRENRLSLG